MAHFNVEHSAQISRDAIAAAQQTAQGQVFKRKKRINNESFRN